MIDIDNTFEYCSSNSEREMFYIAEGFYNMNPQILLRNGETQKFLKFVLTLKKRTWIPVGVFEAQENVLGNV